jgi:cysteinyl-tRNA synthetase
MSKSLGNTVAIGEMAKRWRPVELRYYLAAVHYRSAIEFSPDALDKAAAAYGSVENFVQRAVELVGVPEPVEVPPAFAEAMDDDLNVSRALAIVHNTRRDGNVGLTRGDKEIVRTALAWVLAMTEVLGLNPLRWQGDSISLAETVDKLVELALQQRQAARERKDYQTADAIRDQLAQAGVQVEDTSDGVRWTLAR